MPVPTIEIYKREIRTKKTIQAGIVCHRVENKIEYVEYEPGNGTRYRLLFARLEKLGVEGASDKHVLVTLLHQPLTCPSYPLHAYASWDYIKEKFSGCSKSDAIALCEIINYILGHGEEMSSLDWMIKVAFGLREKDEVEDETN